MVRGSVRLEAEAPVDTAPEAAEEVTPDDVVVDSADYQKVVAYYTDKNGKLSYELLNRNLIKFAHSSKTVRSMLDEGESVKKVRTYIITSKFRTVTGNRNLSEEQAVRIGELLDEVSPKGVFKELDAELHKSSGSNKRK